MYVRWTWTVPNLTYVSCWPGSIKWTRVPQRFQKSNTKGLLKRSEKQMFAELKIEWNSYWNDIDSWRGISMTSCRGVLEDRANFVTLSLIKCDLSTRSDFRGNFIGFCFFRMIYTIRGGRHSESIEFCIYDSGYRMYIVYLIVEI